jgi:hypothetical protein
MFVSGRTPTRSSANWQWVSVSIGTIEPLTCSGPGGSLFGFIRMLPYVQPTSAFRIGSYPFAAAFSIARSSEWLMQIESISAESTPLETKACFIALSM